jgi:hypothetical protein
MSLLSWHWLGQGSFPPPELPSFLGSTNPSAIRIRQRWSSRIRCWFSLFCLHHGCGLPLLHIIHFPCVPSSLPRWNRRLRFSLASPATSAFLVIMASRLPHGSFRGLLNVHSRYSPHGPLAPVTRPFLRVLQVIRYLLTRPECLRLEREFAVPDFHRGGSCAFSRHT